ncbi:hypothetical protein I7I53_07123 [Histoplasma capsulatum var. duboisii H88]|uniref:Uncharacterized protein n=1 Tax=Ajellomyces capsulatus (strain H88) TaxID=544711 RepID=A0A8A1LFP2_AJEC8|nr:hypothetical protein I7I53_07123 [Histoplasma capsulatum var. duboisii H88]
MVVLNDKNFHVCLNCMWRAFATDKKEFLCDRLSLIPIRDSQSLHSAIAIGDLSKLARYSRRKYVN